MTINISGSSYHFNASRLERILKSDNLKDAQQMGLWDSIKDFFQGGVKRQAIEEVFNQMQEFAECGDDKSPEGALAQLLRFKQMKFSAIEEHQSKFKIWVNMELCSNS